MKCKECGQEVEEEKSLWDKIYPELAPNLWNDLEAQAKCIAQIAHTHEKELHLRAFDEVTSDRTLIFGQNNRDSYISTIHKALVDAKEE